MSDSFSLVEPFDIDGMLGNLAPEKCFVLGFEYGDIRHRIDHREMGPFRCHAENVDRLKKLISRRHGLFVNAVASADGWATLHVDSFTGRGEA